MMKHKNISIVFISLLIIAILLMMSPRMLAYTIPAVENLKVEYTDGTANLSWSSVTNADGYEVFVNIPGYGYANIGSVSENKVSVIGISEDTAYSVKVRAYEYVNNIKEVGNFSNEVDFDTNKEADLDRVTGVKVETTGNIAKVEWNAVSEATGYEVYVDIPNYGFLKIGNATTNSAVLMGFQTNGKYAVKIRAFKGTNGKDGYGEFSSSKTFYINSEDLDDDKKEELDQVKDLEYNLEKDKVYLNWSKVKDADEYIVYISINGGNYSEIGRVTGREATINDLRENTTYKVKIAAYNKHDDVYGKESNVITFKTDKSFEEEIELDKVRNLSVDIDGNRAYLDWSKVKDADKYEIYLSKNGKAYSLAGTVTKNSATISDLDYNTSYKVKVRAYNEKYDEYGAYSDIESFKTEKNNNDDDDDDDYTSTSVGTVKGLDVDVKNRNEIALEWAAVSKADGYEVYLSEDGDPYELVLTTEYVRDIVTDLEYNTSYRVKVRAYKEVDGRKKYGSYSSVKSFKTEKYNSSINNEEVGKVKNVNASVTGSTVYLSWKSVPGAVKYEIQFTVPGYGGATSIWSEGPGRTISGLTNKTSNYTARVRAYKYVDGRLVPGEYSDVVRFKGK